MKPIQAAVGVAEGTKKFYINSDADGWTLNSSFVRESVSNPESAAEISVQASPLSSIIGSATVDLLKLYPFANKNSYNTAKL